MNRDVDHIRARHKQERARQLKEIEALFLTQRASIGPARRVTPLIAVMGLAFLAVAAGTWFEEFHRSLPGTLALFGGIVVGALGVAWISPNLMLGYKYLGTSKITPMILVRFAREVERVHEQTNRTGRYIVPCALVLLVVAGSYPPTRELIHLILFSGLGVMLPTLAAINLYRARRIPKFADGDHGG
jgi:hypothetical protein